MPRRWFEGAANNIKHPISLLPYKWMKATFIGLIYLMKERKLWMNATFLLGVFPVNMKKMIGHDFRLMHVVE